MKVLVEVEVPEGVDLKKAEHIAFKRGYDYLMVSANYRLITAPQEAEPLLSEVGEIEFFQAHGYIRDREEQLRALAEGKEHSLALEAANQIKHLKETVADLTQSVEILRSINSESTDNLIAANLARTELEQQLSPTHDDQPDALGQQVRELLVNARKHEWDNLYFIDQICKAVDSSQTATHDERREEWQPIETAPKEKDAVFIGRRKSGRAVTARPHYHCNYISNGDGCSRPGLIEFFGFQEDRGDALIPCELTHWMPLPQSLTSGEQNG